MAFGWYFPSEISLANISQGALRLGMPLMRTPQGFPMSCFCPWEISIGWGNYGTCPIFNPCMSHNYPKTWGKNILYPLIYAESSIRNWVDLHLRTFCRYWKLSEGAWNLTFPSKNFWTFFDLKLEQQLLSLHFEKIISSR